MRAVAMDVVRGAGETRAVAADHSLESFVEPPIVGIHSGEPLARCRDAVTQPLEVDGRETPVLDNQTPTDHDAVDRGAVLGVDELVDRVVETSPVVK